jgi:hypothetical protein
MTVRQAELAMAIATILMSLGLMWSATDGLSIGWVPGRGPGSGFWPFWLAVGMLLASLATLWRWFKGATPESRSDELYMSRPALAVVGTSAGALLALLIGIHVVGIYIALVGFLLFYLKFIGRHDWPITIMLVGGIPVFIFALFEWLLQIPLPKALTEEWFYPVFDVMYGTNHFWMYIVGLFVLLSAISYAVHKLAPPNTGH